MSVGKPAGAAFALVVVAVLASVLAVSCSEAQEAELEAPSIQITSGSLSNESAVNAAKNHAAYLIQDRPVEEAVAERTSYAEASTIVPGGMESNPRPRDSVVWVVTLRGRFYEPSGPPLPDKPATSEKQPTCSVVTVLVDDATGDYIRLTFEPSTGC